MHDTHLAGRRFAQPSVAMNERPVDREEGHHVPVKVTPRCRVPTPTEKGWLDVGFIITGRRSAQPRVEHAPPAREAVEAESRKQEEAHGHFTTMGTVKVFVF
jgi:hypothetical protein